GGAARQDVDQRFSSVGGVERNRGADHGDPLSWHRDALLPRDGFRCPRGRASAEYGSPFIGADSRRGRQGMDTMVADEHTSFRRLTSKLYGIVSSAISWVERKPLAFMVLLAPACLFLVVFFVAPMLLLLRESFVVGGPGERSFSVAQYVHFLGSLEYLAVLWNSIQLGLIVTIVCLLIGYPLAYGLARFGPRWQIAILVSVVSPLVVSVVVR